MNLLAQMILSRNNNNKSLQNHQSDSLSQKKRQNEEENKHEPIENVFLKQICIFNQIQSKTFCRRFNAMIQFLCGFLWLNEERSILHANKELFNR